MHSDFVQTSRIPPQTFLVLVLLTITFPGMILPVYRKKLIWLQNHFLKQMVSLASSPNQS